MWGCLFILGWYCVRYWIYHIIKLVKASLCHLAHVWCWRPRFIGLISVVKCGRGLILKFQNLHSLNHGVFFGLCRCLKSQIFILFVLCPNFVSFDASDIPSFIMRLSSGEQNQPCSSCSIVFLELSSHCQASTAAWEKNSALFWSSYRQWTMDQTWSNHLTYQGGSLRTSFLHWSARILIKWFHLRSAGRSQVNIPNNVC